MEAKIILRVNIANMTTLEFAALVSGIGEALGIDRPRVRMRLAR